MYDYKEALYEDIKQAIEDNKSYWRNWGEMDTDERAEFLNDRFWIDDSVTGNGSGSYTFDSAEAAEYVQGNEDLAEKAIKEFCIDSETIGKHLFDWEYWDVTIRCSLLYEMIYKVLEDMEEEEEE